MRTAESVTLTCWPPAPLERIGVDAEVLVVDLDVDVFGQLRPDVHRGERRVPARRLIERRDAHEPVHAGLRRQQAVGVLAGDRERRALEPGFVARLIVDHLALEAAALGPAQVHAQQHLGPVLRLGAAGAGMDRDDRVLAIVLAAEHLLDLAGLHFLVERVERLRELGVDRLRRRRPTRRARARSSLFFLSDSDRDRDPARAGGGAAGPSALRPDLSRNRARRRAPRGGSVLRRGGRLQR